MSRIIGYEKTRQFKIFTFYGGPSCHSRMPLSGIQQAEETGKVLDFR
ncbi:MAG: hypothetical protein HUU09_00625 [Candidatus Jettenia caeni]|nr:hypothetical protein [Candidatus Jettenia caeni]